MEREQAERHEIGGEPGRQEEFADPGGPAVSSGSPLIRSLQSDDVDAIVRIDRLITRFERIGFLESVVDQALNESAIRVSLVAEIDARVTAFAMARVDFGDYGQTEPVASLDLIGVEPAFARAGIGRALVLQLLTNLRALRVERVETQVEWSNLALLAFLFRCGFGPCQALAFSKKL